MRSVCTVVVSILLVSCGGETKSAATIPSSPVTPTPTPTPPKYVVSGTVRDTAGQPVAAAHVFIGYRLSKTPSGFSTDTDSEGHYQGSIQAGNWDVTVTKPGYEIVSGELKVAADTIFDITFPLTVYLAGKVTELGVGLLDGVTVEIVSGPNMGRSHVTGMPVTGQYFIDHLVPGELTLRASKTGYEPVERTLVVNANTNLDFAMRWSYGTCLTSVAPVLFDLYRSAGGTEVVAVAATPGRTWSATPDSPWIAVVSPTSRTGSGQLTLRVQEYPVGATEPRRGAVLVRCSASEGQNVWINQVPNCQVRLEPTKDTPASFSAAGGTGRLLVYTATPACYWEYRSLTDWITTAGVTHWHGDLEVAFIVRPNATGLDRTGKVVVGETEWIVTQQR